MCKPCCMIYGLIYSCIDLICNINYCWHRSAMLHCILGSSSKLGFFFISLSQYPCSHLLPLHSTPPLPNTHTLLLFPYSTRYIFIDAMQIVKLPNNKIKLWGATSWRVLRFCVLGPKSLVGSFTWVSSCLGFFGEFVDAQTLSYWKKKSNTIPIC